MYADDTNITPTDSDVKVPGNETNNELRNLNVSVAHGELVKSEYC